MRQVIEQFGMRRLFAQMSEIVRRGHDACAKEPEPNAIDEDARRKWVVWIGDEFRQFAPSATGAVKCLAATGVVTFLACASGWCVRLENLTYSSQISARNRLAELIVVAADVESIIIPGVDIRHSVHRPRHADRLFHRSIALNQIDNLWILWIIGQQLVVEQPIDQPDVMFVGLASGP